jgi:hypothetical protein
LGDFYLLALPPEQFQKVKESALGLAQR